jgi:5'-nucleotidase
MQFRTRRLGLALVAAGGSLLLTTTALPGASAAPERHAGGELAYAHVAKKAQMVRVDLLAFNDFHGNLEAIDPAKSSSGRINSTPAGGVAFLASKLRHERKVSRANGARPITVAAGDLIGASPLLSAAFHDEPSIEAMNKLGLQVSSVGNHEFDEGVAELRRMQHGGCIDDGPEGANGANSCPDHEFAGADYSYLSANVFWKNAAAHKRPTVFKPFQVMKVHGQKIAFIGMTLEGTPEIVSQAGIQNVRFADEVETANALVPRLRKKGVKSIVVLLHEGVAPKDATAYNDCSGVSGAGLTIAQDLSPAIDAVISGHTHQPYNCVVQDPKGHPRLFTSASSFGRMITKMHLLINPRTHDIVRPAAYAENQIVRNTEGAQAAADLLDLIAKYNVLVEPIANRVVGHIADADLVSRSADSDGGDSPLGNLIADGLVEDTSVKTPDGQMPVIGLMNPGGIRGDLAENDAGEVTYGAAFGVQPFNNLTISENLTGAQIRAALNQQWNGTTNEVSPKILQVSGLSYTWDKSLAAEPDTDAIVGEILVDDDGDPATAMVPMTDDGVYRVAMNNFIADGGDNFGVLREGTDRINGGLDIDSLVNYLLAHDPYTITPTDRISSVA